MAAHFSEFFTGRRYFPVNSRIVTMNGIKVFELIGIALILNYFPYEFVGYCLTTGKYCAL